MRCCRGTYPGIQVTSVFPDTVVKFYRVLGTAGGSYRLLATSRMSDSQMTSMYFANSTEDLTDVFVNSTKPISVTAVVTCANVSNSIGNCDLLAEQIPAVTDLGTVHIVPPIWGRSASAGYFVRVVATDANTVVHLNCGSACVSPGRTAIAPGSFEELSVKVATQPVQINCSKPCLVMQYNTGKLPGCNLMAF